MTGNVLSSLTSEPLPLLLVVLLSVAFCMFVGMLVGVHRQKKEGAPDWNNPKYPPPFWEDVWVKAILPAEITLVACTVAVGFVFRSHISGHWGRFVDVSTTTGMMILFACFLSSIIAWQIRERNNRRIYKDLTKG
jgi:hypothetical protein